jgi:UDP-glucose 4-epimerase
MMKVLITGGSGFIGSNLARYLVDQAYDVVILDNLSSGFRCNVEGLPQVDFLEGDIRNYDFVKRAAHGAEIIFHLAASVGNTRSIQHPFDDSESNVLGTLNNLEAARPLGVRKIVYSSSAGIFGELKTLPIQEDHPVEPDSPYGVSKLAGEKMCLAYAKLYDLEAVALRYFNVYGPGQRYDAYGNVIPIFAHAISKSQPLTIFGDGEQTRDFINVNDVVQANVKAALTYGLSGAFNLGSGSRVTINWLAKTMVELSGVDLTVVHGAQRPGDVRHSLADTTAAKEAFGFEAIVPLREGLAEYMDWVRAEYNR